MSLQVWLPLTKDLRQQGLSNVTATNNGATFDSSGKLGGCYSFNGSSNYLRISQGYFGTNYSYALWFYTTSTSATQNLGCCRNSTGEGFAIFLINGKIRIDGGGAGDATQWTTNYTFSANTWTHLVVTCDNGILKLYINGIYQGTKTITLNSSKWGTIYSIGASQANGSGYGNYLNGKINDIRIYNHTLSQMEVKQLSQGLVLHYPLNRQGWGQENLLKESQTEKIGASNSAQWFRWNTVPTTLTANQTYTLSFDAKMSIATDVFYISWSNGDSTQEVWNQGTQVTTEYKRYSFTGVTTKTNINAILMSNYKGYNRGNNNNTTGILSVKNVKLELDDKATPWCPVSTDTIYTTMGLDGTTEYDCSGFCNNGIRTGTFEWTSNTPKYAVSTKFSGSNYILTDSGTFSWFDFNQLTLAGWMKPTTSPSSYSGSFGIAHNSIDGYYSKCFSISNSSSKFTVNSAKGSTWLWIMSSYVVPADEWHHYVATLNGTEVKMYVDGELVHSATIDWNTAAVASDTRFQVGVDLPGSDETYYGYYSDIRAYATALSADDVKSLYQNCATIDPDGTIRGQIRS